MTFPNWYGLLLLALAAYRTWKLLAEDTITEGLRKRIGPGKRTVFLECPWCAGFWIALAWWGLYQLWPSGTLIAAIPFVASAIVGILGHFTSDD